MKPLLILLAIAFAILAIVGIATDDARSIAPQISAGAATSIAAQQTPNPELPAIVSAAAATPASAHTILDFNPHLNIHQTPGISTRTHKTAVETHDNVATPLSIPLLI